jgi:diacylglycerol O-acyltransferase
MSATDAGFLYLDRPHAPLQIASLLLLERAVGVDELVSRVESRLWRIPRYAQRAMSVPLALGHPSWEPAPDFDARDHIRRWALPSPGGEHELAELAGRLLEQPLQRDRPLWEMHVIEGCDDGRAALFVKVHHCMVDGLSGVRLLDEILDTSTGVTDPLPVPLSRRRAPGPADLMRRALGDGVRRQLRAAAAFGDVLRRPAQARAAVRGLMDAAWSSVRLAIGEIPTMPWNEALGARRQLYFTSLPLEPIHAVRRARGATVNDVVLCGLAGGLHRYLRGIGVRTYGLELTALVPVSLRAAEEAATLGNRISAILVPLAVDVEDEVARLAATRSITTRLKADVAWTGIDALLKLLDEVPPGLVALLGRGIRNVRIANLIATNVPGPRETRFLCSRRVDAIYPIVPIADGLGLGLAVFSYAGTLYIGLNADPALVPDLEKLGRAIESAFDELRRRA